MKLIIFIKLLIVLFVKPQLNEDEEYEIWRPYDKIQKEYKDEFVNWIFNYFEVDEKIKTQKTTELTTLKSGELRPDFIGESVNGYDVIVEFQTKYPTKEDLRRFTKYAFEYWIQNPYKKVKLYIFSRKRGKEYATFDYSPNNNFEMVIIHTVDKEVNQLLNIIELKILNNEILTDDDKLFLKVGFIAMEDLSSFDVLYKITKLTWGITNISNDEKTEMIAAHLIFSKYLLAEEEFKKIKEEYIMNDNLFKEFYDDGMEAGMKAGMEDVGLALEEIGMDGDQIKEVMEIARSIRK